MIRYEVTVELSRPAPEMFVFLTDPSNRRLWDEAPLKLVPHELQSVWGLSPADAGSELQYQVTVRFHGWARLLEPLVRRRVTKQLDRNLATLKAVAPLSGRLAQACAEVLPVDVCADLETMPLNEALGYAYTLLQQNKIEDPEGFLRSKGVIE